MYLNFVARTLRKAIANDNYSCFTWFKIQDEIQQTLRVQNVNILKVLFKTPLCWMVRNSKAASKTCGQTQSASLKAPNVQGVFFLLLGHHVLPQLRISSDKGQFLVRHCSLLFAAMIAELFNY